jgi:hypothetical protein
MLSTADLISYRDSRENKKIIEYKIEKVDVSTSTLTNKDYNYKILTTDHTKNIKLPKIIRLCEVISYGMTDSRLLKYKPLNNYCKYCTIEYASELSGTCVIERRGSMCSILGIIILKSDCEYLKEIKFEIGGREICRMDIDILIKLYGYDINEKLYFIPIPRRFLINKSIDQNILFNSTYDNEHMYGIPLFCLQYNEFRVSILTTKKIECHLVLNYIQSPWLSYLSYNYAINARGKELSMTITACNKINYCDIKPNKVVLPFNIFKTIILNCNNTSVHTAVYNKIVLIKLYGICIIKELCNLIMSYGMCEINFEIIIKNNNDFYKIENKVLSFNDGILLEN